MSVPPAPRSRSPWVRCLIGGLIGCGVLVLLGVIGVMFVSYTAYRAVSRSLPTATRTPAPAPPSGKGCFRRVVLHSSPDRVDSLASGDLKGDGAAEVLVLAKHRIHILDQAAHETGSFPIDPQTGATSSYSSYIGAIGVDVARLQGKSAILVGAWGDPAAYAYRPNGTLLFRNEVPGTQISGCGAGDLDGDKDDEILIAREGGVGVYCLDSTGQTRWTYAGTDLGNPSVADRNGDGVPEVYVPEVGGIIHVLDRQGRQVDQWSGFGYAAGVRAADLDGDHRDETAVAQYDYSPGAYTAAIGGVDARGGRTWQVDLGAVAPTVSAPFTEYGDLDGDGVASWIATRSDGTLLVLDKNGKELGRHAMGRYVTGLACSRPKKRGAKARLWVAMDRELVGLDWQARTRSSATP
jgi:FG-GAP-like repeat